ncbi:MAG: hypothetical protein CL661_03540 [Bacteroidetes bacterium]|nr:hypothetical protein [Bacteroidota bacterium]
MRNMKKLSPLLLLLLLFVYSCNTNSEKGSIEIWKNEILETEQNFTQLAQEEGIPVAFLAYADEDAVLLRNNKLVIGKNTIREYYANQGSEDTSIKLMWKPEFVDVAESGELGYTYGYYTFSYIDSTGKKVESDGVFHTVWKKQPDGTWRFVWD